MFNVHIIVNRVTIFSLENAERRDVCNVYVTIVNKIYIELFATNNVTYL